MKIDIARLPVGSDYLATWKRRCEKDRASRIMQVGRVFRRRDLLECLIRTCADKTGETRRYWRLEKIKRR